MERLFPQLLMNASIESLSMIEDIGEITAHRVYTFFRNEQTYK